MKVECGGVVVWTRWGERRLVEVECGGVEV